MATVEVADLTKVFPPDVTAVDDVDLLTTEGEFLVLLGPSGCGKTTLLRMIAGLEHPTSGEIRIAGNVVNGLPPRARQIAMVFQSYALYPHKSVAANIEFPLKAESMAPEERRRKVEWSAELLGITRLLDRKPRHLSGGERQRVALARALVRDPSVFLLDEPLSNLDAKLRATARDDLKEFQERVGTTTIYVTHDQVEAMGMGERIAVMSGGRVRQIGPPIDVYDDPSDTFVATFIGSPPMNLVDNGDRFVGFRPETFLPADLVAGDDRVVWRFAVTRLEHLGSERHVYGTLALGGEPTRVIAKLPSTITTVVEPGRDHDFAVHASDLRFFGRETGERASPVPIRSGTA